MKNKLLVLIFLLAFAASMLVSCFNGGNTPDGGAEEPDNLIYNEASELYLIVDPSVSSEYISKISDDIDYNKSELIKYAPVDSEVHKHEIVVGMTDREISKTAALRIDRVEKNTEDELRYVIYSDGSSVAIVWEEGDVDEDNVMQELALRIFYENCVKEELILKQGIAYSGSIDIIEDHYRAIDEAYKQEAWAKFESTYGAELTNSFKQLYAIYSPDCIIWLANLYDPDICVCVDLYGEETCSGTKYCGTGGWYYSNSARDNFGYLPDAESTNQALNFLVSAGLAYARDGGYLSIITEEMKKQIGDFIYSLEEPNGYFYHPQWGIELTDSKLSRRARDLSWCTGILKKLDRTPKYTTASGMKGEDVLGTSSELTGRLGSTVAAVSKVIAVNDAYASHLQDLDSFKAYLASKNLRDNSYSVGNELTAQTPQIQERDRQIGTPDDPTPLMDYLIEWLNAGQNPKTGNWDWKEPGDAGYKDYYGTNGLLKISGIYSTHKVVIPHAREAAVSAMNDIINPAQIGAVVDLYNTWYAIQNILENLNAYGGDEGKAEAESIQAELRAMAPEALVVSRDKIKDFLKPDGSASYGREYSSETSQGVPAAVPKSVEGDVNGSTIAINGIIGHAASALGITRIPTFGEAERALFRKTIRELSPITKHRDESTPDPLDFEGDDIDMPSPDLTYGDTNGGSGNVVADPTGKGMGNVIEMISYSGAGDSIRVPILNSVPISSCYVFEGDFCIMETSSNYSVQVTLGGCYMLSFRPVTDSTDPDYGKIRLVEASSGSGKVAMEEYLGLTVERGEWFRIKVQYFTGDADSVRIKFYADTDITDSVGYKLYAVSDNYYDSNGLKVTDGASTPSASFTSAHIYALSSENLKMYFDNVNAYKTKEVYNELLGQDDAPYFNVDEEGHDRVLYDFENGVISEDITVDSKDSKITVNSAGELSIVGSTNSSTVKFPSTLREKGGKCIAATFDIRVNSANSGEVLLLTGYDGALRIFSLVLSTVNETSGTYLELAPKVGTTGSVIDGVRIPVGTGETVTLKLEYYHAEDIVLIYANGQFSGASSSLFDEANKLTMDGFAISTVAARNVDVTVDNVTVERIVKSFLDAVAPEKDEKIFDFETADPDVTISGSGTKLQAHGGDFAVVMNSSSAKGALTVPVNERSRLINALVFRVSLDYTKLPASGDMHRISFADKAGNVILALDLCYSGGKIELYEVGKGGRVSTPLCSFKSDSTVNISLEVFNTARMIHIKDGAAVIAKSSIFVGQEYMNNGYASVKIESLSAKATVAIDDLRCETLYSIYSTVKVNGTQNTENDFTGGITFESSNSGNLPSSFYSNLYGNNFVAVQNVYNDIRGAYSNALVLNKNGAGNDEVALKAPLDISNANSVVFEADIKVDSKATGCVNRIYFASSEKRQNSMYLLNIYSNSGGSITFEEVSAASGTVIKNNIIPNVKNGEWFKLRVELYKGTRDTVRFKIFVNDVLVGVSNNFTGSQDASLQPAALPSAVSFYHMSNARGEIYIDNFKLYTSDKTCTDGVTVGQ